MTPQERKVMELALEALEMYCEHGAILKPIETRDAIKEALAQPERVWVEGYGENSSGFVKAQPEQEPTVRTATRLWNRKDTWTCPADIGKDLLDGRTSLQPKKPEQEPMAVMELHTDGWDLVEGIDTDWLETLPFGTRLYTTPPQHTWVGLTDEDMASMSIVGTYPTLRDWFMAVEAKLKEKNT